MKKLLLSLFVLLIFSACSKLEDLNQNTKDFTIVPGEAVYNGAVRALCNQLGTMNVNSNNLQLFVQYFNETTYTDEGRYDMVTRPVPANHMNTMYRNVLMNLKEATKLLKTQSIVGVTQQQRDNQLAIIEIMTVFTWSNIIETYGDMPYTEALDVEIQTPRYDDGFTVYKGLLTRLDDALAKLNPAYPGMGSGYDNIYGGGVASIAKWARFANTLKMRMGLVLADKEPALSKIVVDAAEPKAFVAGDKAALTYLKDQPHQNPVYTDVVASGRYDYVVGKPLVDAMVSLSDPRIAGYMWTKVDGKYQGAIIGEAADYTIHTHIDNAILKLKPDMELVIMDYSEAEFLRAEAAARGNYAVTDPATHYKNAITASIKYWGGTDADAATYYAQTAVDYASAAGSWQQKIGTQAWISYYLRGFTSWLSWRRLDYPRLVATPKHVPQVNGIPIRYTFAVSEQTLNGDNYKLAARAIGGDNAMTPLFWDKVQYNTLTGADK